MFITKTQTLIMCRELLWLKRQIGQNSKLQILELSKTRETISIMLNLIKNLQLTHLKNTRLSIQKKRTTFIITVELILTLLKVVSMRSMTLFSKVCLLCEADHQSRKMTNTLSLRIRLKKMLINHLMICLRISRLNKTSKKKLLELLFTKIYLIFLEVAAPLQLL